VEGYKTRRDLEDLAISLRTKGCEALLQNIIQWGEKTVHLVRFRARLLQWYEFVERGRQIQFAGSNEAAIKAIKGRIDVVDVVDVEEESESSNRYGPIFILYGIQPPSSLRCFTRFRSFFSRLCLGLRKTQDYL
jgi:hypothetical protein